MPSNSRHPGSLPTPSLTFIRAGRVMLTVEPQSKPKGRLERGREHMEKLEQEEKRREAHRRAKLEHEYSPFSQTPGDYDPLEANW